MTLPLIIALKDTQNIEKDGQIIQIGNGANTNTVRGLAAEKLGLAIPLEDIILETVDGKELTEIDKVKEQNVVYIKPRDKIKNVPGPRRLPMVGNVYDMLPDLSAGWKRQFETYGPIASISILGSEMVGTNDPAIAELFVKESEYFTKKVSIALLEFKDFAGNGLFTSDTDDMEWQLAHKLLMPAFSPRAIKAYQPEMGRIATETMEVLAQYKPDEKVEILTWCTNLTFETIGRIGFGYSFDLMHRNKEPHPFIEAMAYALSNGTKRFSQPVFMKKLPLQSNKKWEQGNHLMHSTVEKVIQERKSGADAKDMHKDLLGYMLNARDEHNLGLSDENIRDQVVTFLIAGHDTTANTLAWFFYEMTRNPEVETRVLQELANAGITSDKYPTAEQISSLKYLNRVLKEVLRLHSPLRNISKYCKKDCVVPGGYLVKEGTICTVSILNMHTNPKVYPNPEKFDPDRFTPEEEQKRSRYSWLPFSTGPRSCIGMAFALQEAKTVIGMWLHRYKFLYDGPAVPYDPHQGTTKPLNMMMNIVPRTDFPEPNEDAIFTNSAEEEIDEGVSVPTIPNEVSVKGSVELPKVTFLFGTQTGTAQDYANQLAIQAKRFGFKNITLTDMDKWKVLDSGFHEEDPKSNKRELVVICTATYNGQPPDSAENFNKFLDKSIEQGKEDILTGLDYAVFGLGNKNWRTYQAFPLKVDRGLYTLGATRFFAPGVGDADKDMDSDFNTWCAHFWTYTLSHYGVEFSASKSIVPTASLSTEESKLSTASVKFISPTDKEKWQQAQENRNGDLNAKVLVNRELQSKDSGRSTRHIEIDISRLAPISDRGLYEAGDHIEIMPENSAEEVERIALGFGLVLDSVFEVDPESLAGVSPRSMAACISGPCTIRNALTYYADLLSSPSRSMLSCFASQLRLIDAKVADEFDRLTMPDENNIDQYPEFIKKYRTLFDLQQAFPQVKSIEFGQFLTAVGVMQPRRYSISSSPLAYPTHAHISVGVVDDVINGKHYPGLASSYLKRLEQGLLRASLKSSKNTFSMPSNPETPIIMIAAGTGISPFRGFLQERAYMKKNGQKVGPCVLFFGCRHPDQDYIYREEFEEFVDSGVLAHNHSAFSRLVPASPQKYVQHALLANAAEVWSYMNSADAKAAVYICGSGTMSRDVRYAFQAIAKSFGMGETDEEAENYLASLEDQKLYMTDVWG